jgi:hypothetical protein
MVSQSRQRCRKEVYSVRKDVGWVPGQTETPLRHSSDKLWTQVLQYLASLGIP